MRCTTTAPWALLALAGCAVGGPVDDVDDALPCIPRETRCSTAEHMVVCAPDGLSRDVVPCGVGEVCLSTLAGGHCEALPENVRTLPHNFDATFRVAIAGGGYCTGFLISDDVLLTNHHCCDDWEGCVARGVRAEAEVRGVRGGSERFEATAVAMEAPGLDVVALVLAGDPGATFGHVVVARGRSHEGQHVYVLGHPNGEPLASSNGLLYAYRDRVEYVYRDGPKTKEHQVLYAAQAEPGSSGSPVFHWDTGALLAIHHTGGLPPRLFGLDEQATDGFDELLGGTDAEAIAAALDGAGIGYETLARR